MGSVPTRLLRLGVAAAALAAGAGRASAEIHFLAKQYSRCAACHVSPAGGSLLTPYGRSVWKEELAAWGASDPDADGESREEQAFYGLLGSIALGDGGSLDVGLNLRPSRLRSGPPGRVRTRDLWMRADFQVAARIGGWTGYAELGRFASDPPEFISREHWLGYTAENGFGLRVGRFLPAFGLRTVDHEAFHRETLGFDQDDQIYGVEVSDSGERHQVQFALGPGRAESLLDDDGSAAWVATGRAQWELGDQQVLVLSGAYRASSRIRDRHGIGSLAWGIAPTQRLSIWTELDALAADGWKGTPEYTVFHETSFELVRGLWLKFSPQLKTELGNVSGGFTRLGVGAQFLPRSHWNVNFSLWRDRDRVSGATFRTLVMQLQIYL